MKTNKNRLEEILASQNKIIELLTNDKSSKADRFDEIQKELCNVQFHVKSVNVALNHDASTTVVVDYHATCSCRIDDGKIIAEPMFRAINALDMIPAEDQMKIQKAIDKAISLNRKATK